MSKQYTKQSSHQYDNENEETKAEEYDQNDEEYNEQNEEEYNEEYEQNQEEYNEEYEQNQEEYNEEYEQNQEEYNEEEYEQNQEEYQEEQKQEQQYDESNLYDLLKKKKNNVKQAQHIPGLKHDAELEDERKNLWKAFGRETGAGKALFSLYKSHQAPKINYPKIKTKPKQAELPKEKKKCPQKTQIEYPDLPQPQRRKFHQIDFVMRRKPEWEIRQEIDNYFSKRDIPANRGVDRQKLVKSLQKKFKDQRGALPKGAELPSVGNIDDIEITEEMKLQAIKRTSKKNKNFTNHQDEDDPTVTGTQISQDPMQELEAMFNSILKEIEERQKELEQVNQLKDNKQFKEKLKKEIVERVSELQKVTELKQYYKQKQGTVDQSQYEI